MNHFENKIFEEFEKNLNRILGMTLEEYETILKRHGDRPLDEFRDTFNNEGADATRFVMNWSIVNLSVVYHERELGRKMTTEEIKSHAVSLGLGLEHY